MSYLPIRMHLFLVANSLDAVQLILPFVIYTEQVSLTSFDTWMVGFLSCFWAARHRLSESAWMMEKGLEEGVVKEELIEYNT